MEEVETLTFNLLNGVEVSATENKLAEYAAQNAAVISHNATLEYQESANLEARQAAEREEARLRREAARREEEDERRAREEGRKEVIEQLTHGNKNAVEVVKESKRVELLKRRRAAQQAKLPATASGGGPSTKPSPFIIKGLKSATAPSPEKPYDPFGGLTDKRSYYVLQDHYEHPWLDQARTDPHITTGGYSVKEYCARAMFEAFSGLGVFIEEEVAGRKDPSEVAGGSSAADAVATAVAVVNAEGARTGLGS